MTRAEDCIFCNIVERHAPADIVYEDGHSIAFLDIYPLNPGHTLVVSKKHYGTLDEMPPEEVGLLFSTVAKVMKGLKEAVGADGINIGQSNGKAASQDLFHVHVNIIPRFTQESSEGKTFPDRKKLGKQEMEKLGRKIKSQVQTRS
ncbi:HIT family protein [Candidatus Bathyarchaeota archaeon]|nr:MAG: HIT family protein [Candidatus Bathyarchaeota archaeon]